MGREIYIGVNLASMLPWAAVPGIGLPLAAWMTRKAGYAFWQVLPLRSVTVAGLRRVEIPIRFVEPAWNPTTFRAHFQGKLGAGGTRTLLQDPLFFPDPKESIRRFDGIVHFLSPQPIYHHLVLMYKGGLVEIHPGLKGTVGEWVAVAEEEKLKPFVVDLRHLRRFQMSLSDMWRSLELLLPLTSLIHVQAVDWKEWQDFAAGNATLLGGMIQFACKGGYTGPFVVEFDPRAMGPTGLLPWVLADNLRHVRERVEEYSN